MACCSEPKIEWCTRLHNNKHAIDNGLWNHRGENHSMSKWSDKEIEDIKTEVRLGVLSQNAVAKKHNMSSAQISRIINNKRRSS